MRKVSVHWEEERERDDPDGQGMLVDRGHFDRLLLEHARGCGVRILQPATVKKLRAPRGRLECRRVGGGPDDRTGGAIGRRRLRPGRPAPRRRCRTGPQTLALHAYWTGAGLPDHPRIEAGAAEWFWGVPLPDGVYNTLVFLDPRDLRAMQGTLNARFHELIAASSLLPSGVNASLVGRIQADRRDSVPRRGVCDGGLHQGG